MTIGSLLMTLPQFLSEPRTVSSSNIIANDSAIFNDGTISSSSSTSSSSSSSTKYWYILLIGQLVYGIGLGPSYSLLISYLDDGAKPKSMPIYLSVLMTTLVAVPAATSMLLASYVLTIYVDFYRVVDGDPAPKNPSGK